MFIGAHAEAFAEANSTDATATAAADAEVGDITLGDITLVAGDGVSSTIDLFVGASAYADAYASSSAFANATATATVGDITLGNITMTGGVDSQLGSFCWCNCGHKHDWY